MAGNLPDPLTPFVGRRRELAELRRLLGDSRALTLVGPGGVGKTRLALALAGDRRRAFADGVWYVSADGIGDADLLLATVSDVLAQYHPSPGVDGYQALAGALREHQLLLVLDNCEHVAAGAARLAEALLRTCPRIRIVATSREPLRMPGETTYQVPPLFMPLGQEAGERVEDLVQSDAVRFFVDRARAAWPSFELDEANRAAVVDVVRRLDRLPLALELAAVRLRTLTVQQLLERLTSSGGILDWPGSMAPFRQQTMRASLRWSSELCTDDERSLWAMLSVFRGTFDLDAVEGVCHGLGFPGDVVDLLQGLVEKSIVLREDHGPSVRFSMLRIVRHYGRELLDGRNDLAAEVRSRAMQWYLDLAVTAESEWSTARQQDWLRRLPLDHRNIVHALTAAPQGSAEQVDKAGAAVLALWRYYWWACGWEAEGILWSRRYVDLVSDRGVKAALALQTSLLAWTVGDVALGTRMLELGERDARESGSVLALGLAEHVRGDAAMYASRHGDAVHHFRAAISTYGGSCPAYQVDSLLMLMHASAILGDVQATQEAHAEVLEIVGDDELFQRSYAWLYLAEALVRDSQLLAAREAARSALGLKSKIDDPFGFAWGFEVQAQIAAADNRPEVAAKLLGAASSIWRGMGVEPGTVERLQIRDRAVEERLRRSLGPAFAEKVRAGEALPPSEALRLALDGGTAPGRPQHSDAATLTAREAEVAALVADGLTNKQIAARLVIAHRTVDAHVQNILSKRGFTSRAQIASWVSST